MKKSKKKLIIPVFSASNSLFCPFNECYKFSDCIMAMDSLIEEYVKKGLIISMLTMYPICFRRGNGNN